MITAEAIMNAKKQHKSLVLHSLLIVILELELFSDSQALAPMVMLSAIRHFAKITLFMACTPPEAQLSTCLGVITVKMNFGRCGVARTSPMLGHSIGTLRLYELLHEVQKHLGGFAHAEKFHSLPGWF